LAEFWKDIDEYKWNVPSNANKDTLTGQNEGTSLILFNNKGAWPKTFDLHNRTFSLRLIRCSKRIISVTVWELTRRKVYDSYN